MQSFDPRVYRPTGNTLRRLHESQRFTRLVAGPYGSGKTTACAVAEPYFTAMIQKPNSQGVREAKVGVLRDTYRNLYRTTIQDWLKWTPKDFGHFVGSDDRPAIHEIEFMAPFVYDRPETEVGPCRLKVEFLALGGNSVQQVTGGWAIHGAFLDEADGLPQEALSYVGGRTKRGGEKQYRRSRGVWGAFNKPDVDHWLYDLCVEDAGRHEEMKLEFFDQPAGILPGTLKPNPAADNVQYLDDDYYETIAAGRPDWWVRRFCRNEWGASYAGEPIFGEPDLDALFSKIEIEPDPGDELILGLDGGGTPAAVVGGRRRSGGRFVYGEVVLTDPTDPKGRRILHGVGPKRFAEAIGDVLLPRFVRQRVTLGWGDPSAFYGADREFGEYSLMELVSQHLKIPIQPAPSNELELRLEAVRTLMNRVNPLDQRRDLQINPSCRWLRRGFAGEYKYEPRDPKQPGKRLKPQKSASSHVMEALQYWALGDVGRAGIVAGRHFDRHQPPKSEGLPGGDWRQTEGGVWAPQRAGGGGGGQGSYSSDWSPWD